MSIHLTAAAAHQVQWTHLAHSDQLLRDDAMFPSTYYDMFPAFPEGDRVFVAMPFTERFSLRWEHVIEPGIRAAGLDPYRVDLSKIADLRIPAKLTSDSERK